MLMSTMLTETSVVPANAIIFICVFLSLLFAIGITLMAIMIVYLKRASKTLEAIGGKQNKDEFAKLSKDYKRIKEYLDSLNKKEE